MQQSQGTMQKTITGLTLLEMQNLPEEEQKKLFEKLNEIRSVSKQVNFACVYGAGGPKISESAGISLKEGKLLHKIYWQRNKAVKQAAEDAVTKTTHGGKKKWIYNPVSGFWYSLRAEKDRFATLNSSTGVFCFDKYIAYVRAQEIKISMQMHDEILFKTTVAEEDNIKKKLNYAIKKVNTDVQLNVPLAKSVDFGENYADVH